MAGRSNSGAGCAARLFLLAGVILVIAGAIMLIGSTRDMSDAAPANFGEDAPPLRPTVTPLPVLGQIVATPVPPESLSDTPLVPIEQALPALVATPTPIAPSIRIPTRIVIHAIDLDAPIEISGWHTIDGVSEWDIPDHFAAGWLKLSAPLGQIGNTVLTGHHNIDGEVFRRLVELKPGDQIVVYSDDEPFFYTVTTRKILRERDQPLAVRLKNAQWIQPTDDERLTLVTCWPYTSNTHRLIIVAIPMDLDRNRGIQ